MNSNKNRRAYITAIAGMVAIGALVCIGMVTNEEPDMTIPISPTPMAYDYPELDSSYLKDNEKDKAPTPTGIISDMPGLLEEDKDDKPSVSVTPAATTTPTKVPDRGDAVGTTGVVDKEDEAQKVSAAAIAELSLNKERGLNWPVLGEVVLRFSTDHGIYHETLASFRTNDGVLLAAEVGTPVVATAEGIVTDISKDTMRGTCITMALGDSYVAVYGQLGDVTCEVGDKLAEGDRIGYVADPTKYYSLEGAHLYFKITEDGTAINPLLMLRTLSEGSEE